MDRNILLTYSYINENTNRRIFEYEWIEDKDELQELLDNHKKYLKDFKIEDCIRIFQLEDINTDEL